MTIPPNLRHYIYTGAHIASGILLVVGIVSFWAAISFEGYLLALIALALAGCAFTGVQELKSRGYLAPKPNEQQDLAVLTAEDGSSPGTTS